MNFKNKINNILPRKIIASAISSSLFAVLLALVMPNPMVPNPMAGTVNSIKEYFLVLWPAIPIYLIYSFPVILIYGTLTSLVSDYASRLLANYTNKKFEVYFSLILHLFFGLILLWIGLLAAALFFLTDLTLRRQDGYTWRSALKSLGIPILIVLVFLGSWYIIGALLTY